MSNLLKLLINNVMAPSLPNAQSFYTGLLIVVAIEAINWMSINIVTLSLLITVVMSLQFSLLSPLSLLCLTARHYHFSPIILQLVASHSILITHYDTDSV